MSIAHDQKLHNELGQEKLYVWIQIVSTYPFFQNDLRSTGVLSFLSYGRKELELQLEVAVLQSGKLANNSTQFYSSY